MIYYFKEYKQEFRNITAVTPKQLYKGEGGVILTKKTLKNEDGDVILERRNSFSEYDSQLFDDRNSTLNSHYSDANYHPRLGPYYHNKPRINNNFEDMANLSSNNEDSSFIKTNILKTKPNGFDEKLKNALEEEYDNRHLEEHEEDEKGISVQVLYSYEPLEDDELTLVKGNIFKN